MTLVAVDDFLRTLSDEALDSDINITGIEVNCLRCVAAFVWGNTCDQSKMAILTSF